MTSYDFMAGIVAARNRPYISAGSFFV